MPKNAKKSIGSSAGALKEHVKITDRTALYAESLANPWAANGARVPISPSLPSSTYSTKVTGSVSTGPNACGFVYVNHMGAIVSDGDIAWATTAAYGGTVTTTAFSTGGVGVVGFRSNSAYLTADIAPSIMQYRVVSAGLRIFSTDPVLDLGGSVAGVCLPSTPSIDGITYPQLTAMTGVHRARVTARTYNLTWCPCSYDDFMIQSSVPNEKCMGFMIVSHDATAFMTFDFELVVNYELYGRKVMGALRTVPDPQGVDAVIVAKSNEGIGHKTGPSSPFKELMGDAAHFLADQSGVVVGPVGQKILQAGAQYIAPRPSDLTDMERRNGAPSRNDRRKAIQNLERLEREQGHYHSDLRR